MVSLSASFAAFRDHSIFTRERERERDGEEIEQEIKFDNKIQCDRRVFWNMLDGERFERGNGVKRKISLDVDEPNVRIETSRGVRLFGVGLSR